MTISRGVSAVILRWENKLKIYSDNFLYWKNILISE